MNFNPLVIKRRNILGDLYKKCDPINSIPVYMTNISEDPIGFVDETLGQYVDGFVFHLPDDVRKKLSVSGYDVGVDYNFTEAGITPKNQRIKLNHIVLIAKASLEPIPRHKAALAVKKAGVKNFI
ncbi:MAG: hypothetical protein JWN60_1899 [Acidobacteria bacterium]|jgi:hypothetical protein|nr:hypothetical protein [Acidobacteriota bacterium]